MDTTKISASIDSLSSDLDTLEEALAPLLNTPITTLSAPLPLVDKAKLYTLSTYAIESLLFSYVRLTGADAKTHPVFAELARTKTYFDKIKRAEDPNYGKPTMRVDKGAVGRFVKAGLAGIDTADKSTLDSPGEKRKAATEGNAPDSESKRRRKNKKEKRNDRGEIHASLENTGYANQ